MTNHHRPVELLDTTLRDGGYHIDFQFTAEDTADLCAGLEDAGYRAIEIGHGLGLGASGPKYGVAAATDEEYIEAAARSLKTARFGAFLIPGIGTLEHLERARKLGMHFVRVGTNVNESHKARPFIERARELGYEVWMNLMKSYAVPAAEFAKIAGQTARWGAQTVVIVDSAGTMLPAQVRDFVTRTKDACDAKVGLHAHNNLHMAAANSLEAVEAGADSIDVTLRGMGRSSGNAQSDVILALFSRLGLPAGPDIFKTMDLSEQLIAPRLNKRGQGCDPEEVVLGLAGFHSQYMPLIEEAARAFGVDFRELIVAVSAEDQIKPTRELVFAKAEALFKAHRLAAGEGV